MGDPHQESIAFDSRTIQRLPQCGNVAEYGHNGCPMSGGRDISGVWANQERSGGGSNLNHTLHWKKERLGKTKPRLLSRASFLVSCSRKFSRHFPDVRPGCLFWTSFSETSYNGTETSSSWDEAGTGFDFQMGNVIGLGREYYRPWTEISPALDEAGTEMCWHWTGISSALDGNITGQGRWTTEGRCPTPPRHVR